MNYKTIRILIPIIVLVAISIGLVVGYIVFSVATIKTETPWLAAVTAAAAIPSFAGVVLAAFALTAYMRAEDPVIKSSARAWQARNSFLFALDVIRVIIGFDIPPDDEKDPSDQMTHTRKAIAACMPIFEKSLFRTELGRAIVQSEESKDSKGSKESKPWTKGNPKAQTAVRCIRRLMEAASDLLPPNNELDALYIDKRIAVFSQQADKLQRVLRDNLAEPKKLEKILRTKYDGQFGEDYATLMRSIVLEDMQRIP